MYEPTEEERLDYTEWSALNDLEYVKRRREELKNGGNNANTKSN